MKLCKKSSVWCMNEYARFCLISLAILAVTVILVVLSTHFLDREIALYVYQNKINAYKVWPYFSGIADLLGWTLPLFFLVYIAMKGFNIDSYCVKTLWLMGISLMITAFFIVKLKFIFSRYWPLVWKGNLAFIPDNAYGFNFFQGSSLNQSFPSGHTGVVFAAMSVAWMMLPKLRWLWTILSLLVVFGLLGQNHHFFSDIIAGASLGSLIGMLTSLCFNRLS